MTEAEAESILSCALLSERGIVVNTSNASLLKAKLYSARAAARKRADTSFDNLSFRTSPVNPDKELWIVKTKEESNGISK